MQKAIRTLLVVGAVLAIVDALVLFILAFVFFNSAAAAQNGQENLFGDMSSDSIAGVAIAFLMISIVSLGAGTMCILSLRYQNKIFYIVCIPLCVIAGLVGPGIVGAGLALFDLFKNPNKKEQPTQDAQAN